MLQSGALFRRCVRVTMTRLGAEMSPSPICPLLMHPRGTLLGTPSSPCFLPPCPGPSQPPIAPHPDPHLYHSDPQQCHPPPRDRPTGGRHCGECLHFWGVGVSARGAHPRTHTHTHPPQPLPALFRGHGLAWVSPGCYFASSLEFDRGRGEGGGGAWGGRAGDNDRAATRTTGQELGSEQQRERAGAEQGVHPPRPPSVGRWSGTPGGVVQRGGVGSDRDPGQARAVRWGTAGGGGGGGGGQCPPGQRAVSSRAATFPRRDVSAQGLAPAGEQVAREGFWGADACSGGMSYPGGVLDSGWRSTLRWVPCLWGAWGGTGQRRRGALGRAAPQQDIPTGRGGGAPVGFGWWPPAPCPTAGHPHPIVRPPSPAPKPPQPPTSPCLPRPKLPHWGGSRLLT